MVVSGSDTWFYYLLPLIKLPEICSMSDDKRHKLKGSVCQIPADMRMGGLFFNQHIVFRRIIVIFVDMNTKTKLTFPFLEEYRPKFGVHRGFKLDREDILEETRGKGGVYNNEATKGFQFPYPGGMSNIIYIGKSDDFMTRLKENRQTRRKRQNNPEYGMSPKEPWISSKYQYMRAKGARVYYYPAIGNQSPKEMEATII